VAPGDHAIAAQWHRYLPRSTPTVTSVAVDGASPLAGPTARAWSACTSRFVALSAAGATGTAHTNCRISRSALSSSAALEALHSSATRSPGVGNRLFTPDHRKASLSVRGASPSMLPPSPMVCPSWSSRPPRFAVLLCSASHTEPHDGHANAPASRAASSVSTPCHPVRCSRSGLTHALHAGHGRTIRLLLPLEYSCHVRPRSVLTVHSHVHPPAGAVRPGPRLELRDLVRLPAGDARLCPSRPSR